MKKVVPNKAKPAGIVDWFDRARFGMFIHWGLYSLLERGEWVMLQERIPPAEYAKLARRFNPKSFSPDQWADLAVEAGMKYVVLTAKHHDGFALFDSRFTEFTSTKTASRRDFVAEFVKSCRKKGLKVGLYYSLFDWRYSGYFDPEKYADSARAMVQLVHDQVKELMTNYGKIDLLWYDGCRVLPDWPPQTVAAFWRAKELNRMVRRYQPQILINDRSGTPEDIDTCEQMFGKPFLPGRRGEICMTMGDFCGWGYIRHNPNFKTTAHLLQVLVTAAGREGNFLLNIGPKANGTVRAEEVKRLKEIGNWLRVNGKAIYGSQRCDLPAGDGSYSRIWNLLGPWTRKGSVGYWHLFRYPGQEAVIPRIGTKAVDACLLSSGQKLTVRQDRDGRMIISGLPKHPPDPVDTVVKVRFAGPPQKLKEGGEFLGKSL